MSEKENKISDSSHDDPLGPTNDLASAEVPAGIDRRDFLIRSAVVGAAAIMTGKTVTAAERTYDAARTMPPALTITRGLHVHSMAKGPIMTTFDELFKVGPGPSSSHTIGVMRSTFDFSEHAAHREPIPGLCCPGLQAVL